MTVVILHLSGLTKTGAGQAADTLLNDRSHTDLSRTLVVDDTAALTDHAEAFERLLTSRRLDHLVCVAVGPRAGNSREIQIPGNIGGAQGSTVIWVSDPLGVDWRLATSGIAVMHNDGATTGLSRLLELLSVAEVFDRVCELAAKVPGGIASPGLRLTGMGSEADSFTLALAMAIRHLTGPKSVAPPGDSEPFAALQGSPSGAVRLAEDGELSRHRSQVSACAADAAQALTQLAGVGGLLGVGQTGAREQIVATGTALAWFRDRVAGLLQQAHAPGGLTESQRNQILAAGVRLPSPAPAADGDGAASPPGPAAVSQAIAESLRGSDTLSQLIGRLARTERQMAPRGSGSYLPEVDQRCPETVVHRLTNPPPQPLPQPWLPTAGALAAALAAFAGTTWGVPGGIGTGLVAVLAWTGVIALTVRKQTSIPEGGVGRLTIIALIALAGGAAGAGIGAAVNPARPAAVAGLVLALVIIAVTAAASWRGRIGAWRRSLGLEDAVRSGDALADLVTTVATREWSGAGATAGDVARARITLDGISERLRSYADGIGAERTGSQALRVTRLSTSLSPALRDLVLTALGSQSSSASADGRATFDGAQAKTAELVATWERHAQENGALSPPPFATPATAHTSHADDAGVAEITAAITHDPRSEMWQLCTAADLSALDVASQPQVVAFAPRLAEQPPAGVLPPDTVWTTSGQHAGLLRLVPLRAGIARSSWSADDEEPSS